MDQRDFCRRLGWSRRDLIPMRPVWRRCAARQNEVPPFYREDFIRTWAYVMKPDDRLLEQMIEAGKVGAATPEGRLFGWLLCESVYHHTPVLPVGALPLPEKAFGEYAGLLQLLVALGAFPMIFESFRAAGIPQHYAEACGGWLAGTVTIYRAAHNGSPGHTLSQLFWMRHYIELEVFRIGRLELETAEYPDLFPVICRHRTDGRVMAVCRNARWFHADGSSANIGDAGAVRTRLKNANGVIEGTPVDPIRGVALLGQTVSLPLTEWEIVCRAGEPTVSIHIPGGGGLTPELVVESLREAAGFYRKYLGLEPKIWCCSSWILNPDWEKLIPDTNIVRFGRLGFRCPSYPAGGRDGLFFIFGRSEGEPESFPARTRMEKAFHQVWEQGGKLCCGSMFVLTADLDELELDFYRRTR